MPTYQILIAVFSYLIGVHADTLYDVHMLQQNSYRTSRYLRWMRQEPSRFQHGRHFLGFLPFALAPFGPQLVLIAWCIAYPTLFAIRKHPVQKKKLVITSRVVRLLIVHAAVIGTIAISAWQVVSQVFEQSILSPEIALLALLTLLAYISPLVLTVSNLAALPMEWLVGRFYYYDARRILASSPNLTAIAITGSYGKTSTKLVLNHLLTTHFNALATPQSYNTPMGIIRVIRSMLRPIHQVFVVEMGARQQGDIKELCHLVEPKIGIITAIGEQHLETFRDINVIAATKLELFAALPDGGMAFYNADDSILRNASKRADLRYITYGIDATDADYRAIAVATSAKGTEFAVAMPNGENISVRTRLLGRHNVYNILAAIAVSCELGIRPQSIAPAVAALQPAPHRLEIRRTNATGVTILDDAFSSNPLGAKYALEVLSAIEGSRKILVTPGMVELGAKEFLLNKEFGKQAAAVCNYIVLVGPKRTQPIQEGLKEANYPAECIHVATDLSDAQRHLGAYLCKGDVVLYENDLPDSYNEMKAQS